MPGKPAILAGLRGRSRYALGSQQLLALNIDL